MTFNQWWEKEFAWVLGDFESNPTRTIAQAAWDAALEQAARLADDDWWQDTRGDGVADKIRELKEKP